MGSGFYIENFGCRAARADGEAVSDRLRKAGLCERNPAEAEVVVVNTCSVTAEADRSARAFIRRAHRLNPAAKIVVTGCYAQRAPEELAVMPGVAAVIGNSHKGLAPEIILSLGGACGAAPAAIDGSDVPASAMVTVASLLSAGPARYGAEGHAPIWADEAFAHSFLEEAQLVPGEQTRPNLKIQEGCNNRCTFCVIPHTRGGSKSLAAASVLKQVEGFVAAGGKELVLSGINLGRWGRDFEKSSLEEESAEPHRLAALVRAILTETGLARLRLSSIEPMDWDPEMIALMAEFGEPLARNRSAIGRLARHAHLPLQSGSDAVLRRMHRRYRPWHYAEKVDALLRAAGPALTLGTDVMVGFPGETDAEFEETLEMVRGLPFGYLHLFPFSPRPGTAGWAFHARQPVPHHAVEERMKALRALAVEKSKAHRGRFVGQELEAITQHTPAELAQKGQTAAVTENFLPVELAGRIPANQLVRLRVNRLGADGTLEAALVNAEY
jgi:threonylcarbamoyladenosine tRNA methylthiotransferase MtaB